MLHEQYHRFLQRLGQSQIDRISSALIPSLRKKDLLELPFRLHGMSASEERGVASGAWFFLLALDYRLPERNMDFPAAWIGAVAERCAPAAHRAAWRSFMERGGLEGAVSRFHEQGWRLLRRERGVFPGTRLILMIRQEEPGRAHENFGAEGGPAPSD